VTEQTTAAKQPATAGDVLTARQVAEYLQIPLRSVYEYAARGELPSVHVGRHLRFLRSQLERHLAESARSRIG
jgi:excisionase family DNA binding protein